MPNNMKTYSLCIFLFILVSDCWSRKFVVPDEFTSIYSALGEADEGDTVYVRNGTHKGTFALVDNVTLLGEDKNKTIIKGERRLPVVIGADGAVLKNFTITHGSFGVLCKTSMPTITGNIIKGNRRTGIFAINALPEIVDNEISNNGQFGIFLHRVTGYKTSIHENNISDHGNCGIYCNNRTDALIARNTFVNNRRYGVFGRDSRDSRVFQNTFVKNRFPFNRMVISDKNNRVIESLVDISTKDKMSDTLHTYYGIPGVCHPFNVEGIRIPTDRDCIRSNFLRRYSERLYNRMCGAPISIYPEGIFSYQAQKYWDAAVHFGRTLCYFPNFTNNVHVLYLLSNSFMQLGLLNCAKCTLERGLTKYPTSSYVVQYNLAFLKIAFLEDDHEKLEHYFSHLQDYCLPEDIERDVNQIKKLSEEYNSRSNDTLIQVSVIPDSINNELKQFELEVFTNIMSKPIPARIEALKEFRTQYEKHYRLIYDRLFAAKLAELDF